MSQIIHITHELKNVVGEHGVFCEYKKYLFLCEILLIIS